ncbi:DNA polymerase III subunit gamma/tau [Flavobacterium sp.]|uniref:DNA polymerase III subunit gamma/tau n=1 Tax=Flavobacterium sp. TaxID=239 RepID=UPI0037BECE98
MLDAIGLHHPRWRKKKVEPFIIPPTYFRRTDYSIVEKVNVNSNTNLNSNGNGNVNSNEKNQIESAIAEPATEINSSDVIISTATTNPIPTSTWTLPTNPSESHKVSALSLSSIRAKRELLESTKGIEKVEAHFPTEAFTETEMLLQWSKYAQRLGDKGHKIMESLLLIGDPKLEGTTITHELPNEGSKIEFESERHELLGYLRGKLHNHDIMIDVVVNEKVENKFAFTPQDKYNRLNEINPNLELLKKTFDLDI